MARIIFAAVFAIMILAGMVSAYDMAIEITTIPDSDVMVKVTDPFAEIHNLIGTANGTSDASGLFLTTFTSSKSPVDVIIMLSQNGSAVRVDGKSMFKYTNRQAGLPLNVIILPGRITPENGSAEIQEIAAEETQTESSADTIAVDAGASANTEEAAAESAETDLISGMAVDESNAETNSSSSWKSYYTYIIVGAIAGLLAVFLLLKAYSSKKSSPTIKLRKYSELKKDMEEQQKIAQSQQAENTQNQADSDILAAEQRIKAAEDELKKIKESRQQLRSAEQRFLQAKQDLERVKNSQADLPLPPQN